MTIKFESDDWTQMHEHLKKAHKHLGLALNRLSLVEGGVAALLVENAQLNHDAALDRADICGGEPSKTVLDWHEFVASIIPSGKFMLFQRFEVYYSALLGWSAVDLNNGQYIKRQRGYQGLVFRPPHRHWPDLAELFATLKVIKNTKEVTNNGNDDEEDV